MIYINEWFPNPIGADASGEFVELYNGSSSAVSLAGWKLGAGTASTTTIIPAKTKPVSLAAFSVPAHGYLVLKKAQDKITLKNIDGALLLYGPRGTVADRASFAGTAPEGKSFSRVSYDGSAAQHFIFAEPTPGAANAKSNDMIASNNYPVGVPLGGQSSQSSSFASASLIASSAFISSPGVLAIGTALIIAVIFFYAFFKNEYLSNFLFGGDEAPR
jgi:hypothetical protein